MYARVNKFVDYAGMLVIAAVSFGYLLYYRRFAELHIYSDFLKAPFFVGEMAFSACALLFIGRSLINPIRVRLSGCLIFCYFIFLMEKTVIGYFTWGPLALRHAVLFAYPFFALFGYSFFREEVFSGRKNIFLIAAFLLILEFWPFHLYFSLTLGLLSLVLIRAYPDRRIRYALYGLLLLVFPYRLLFDTSRTFLVGNLAAIAYLGAGIWALLRIKRRYKLAVALVLSAVILLVLLKVGRTCDLKSLVSLGGLMQKYGQTMEMVRTKNPTFVQKELDVKLYDPEKCPLPDLFMDKDVKSEKPLKPSSRGYFGLTDAFAEEPVEGQQRAQKKAATVDLTRTTDVAHFTAIFRMLIWGDAIKELRQRHPLFGFDFGKPFRSRSLEITGNASGEWGRDGWICIHNSYIDMIYRAGLAGVLIVAGIWSLFGFLAAAAFKRRDFRLLLLTGALLNWLVAANFLEILEMPYSAIPFWSLFGMTYAYLAGKRTQ